MFRFLLRWLFGSPVYEHQLVTGTSFVGAEEAAAEAQRKVVALAAAGWKAVSTGCGGRATGGSASGLPGFSGAGAASEMIAGGTDVQVVDIVVLLRREV
jgi:hypothetical protein